MKGVPIKFRGKRDFGSGEYVYGYYVPWSRCSKILKAATLEQFFVLNERWTDKAGLLDDTGDLSIVEADSISQLVGYDAAGNELYEGDEVNVYHSFYRPASELVNPRDTGTVELCARVFPFEPDINSPMDYQFLKKEKPASLNLKGCDSKC